MAEYQHGDVEIRMWPDFTKEDVETIICNLRATDRYEATALGEDGDRAIERSRQIVGSTPVSYIAYNQGRPVFIFGVTAYRRQHSVGLWGFGTEETRKVIPAVTRFVKRQWLSVLRRAGVSRIEAHLPSSCTASLSWLKSCGMELECELLGATVTGEPLAQLSYTWKDA